MARFANTSIKAPVTLPFHFLFVCKPDSHIGLYHWVDQLQPDSGLHLLTQRVKNGAHFETCTCRFANGVPLTAEEDALKVNWCELTVTNKKGEVLYRNAFITDFEITPDNVASLVATTRARWKIENENNNVLKNRGYHLEHNFGHGKKHLSSLLAARYRFIRATLLTRYMLFADWDTLLDFMMRRLEIGPYAPKT